MLKDMKIVITYFAVIALNFLFPGLAGVSGLLKEPSGKREVNWSKKGFLCTNKKHLN